MGKKDRGQGAPNVYTKPMEGGGGGWRAVTETRSEESKKGGRVPSKKFKKKHRVGKGSFGKRPMGLTVLGGRGGISSSAFTVVGGQQERGDPTGGQECPL